MCILLYYILSGRVLLSGQILLQQFDLVKTRGEKQQTVMSQDWLKTTEKKPTCPVSRSLAMAKRLGSLLL
jgi:hypothetical protein